MTGLALNIRRKAFPSASNGGEHVVLSNVALDVAAGSFVSILGPSGCGKTTLLKIVAGLDADFDGEVVWSDTAAGGRPKIGFVFQEPTLLPWRTVGENLRLVMTPGQIERRMDQVWLDSMGLGTYGDSYPKDLSLGMSRRVALARAFAVEPDILLMDEPFVSLDEETAQGLRQLLLRTWGQKPTTVLFVTHDSREALQLAERLLIFAGTPTRVVRDEAIPLSVEERADPRKIDALRNRIKGVSPDA